MNHRILIVEDDETLGNLLQTFLSLNQYRVEWLKDGDAAFRLLKKSKFDLCLADVMMPNMDGFELLEKLRARKNFVPFIFLTAKALKADKLKGLHTGADDYITKPVDEDELLARIEAVLRRAKRPVLDKVIHTIGKYNFLVEEQVLAYNEEKRYLTEMEADLLLMLCNSGGAVLERSFVLQKLWGKEDYFTRRSMDVFISRLRKYLSKDDAVQIKNIHGKGFVLIKG